MEIQTLLTQGEGPRLEFKSTLQWDVKQGVKNEALRKNVLKTIAAFLNTEGGTLVIGVEDDGRVYGLEADLSLAGNSRDRFAQTVANLLVENLGAAYTAPPLVTARFEKIEGKTVYVMDIQPAPEPVFLKGEKGREFYIRVQTTTRELDAQETVKYAQSHWAGEKPSRQAGIAGQGESEAMLKPFHTIAIPHDDILQGRLTLDVFAADLEEVRCGRGVEEYRNPLLFFQKTHETVGLKELLTLVEKRLEGEGGDPVVQLQTPFGGGKTHALIALYHKAAEWGVQRVVMVGTAMSATDTLWGMLEEQLTGKKQNFTGLTSPGRTALRALLENQGAVLILLDEVLEYVTKAAGRAVGESTLAAQTIAFMQELTELVATLERVALVVTLPSSLIEHYDQRAEHLFQQLQRVSGRVEKIYTPVQENEIAAVIRRRLFSHVDQKAANAVISVFMDYAARESLLPAGVEPSDYRARFQASYPFLPDVIDVLYQRWGSFPNFQRTRGVLRLLGMVIHDLKNSSLPYITLADFNLSNQEIRRELLKHIGNEYDSVIAADITGPEAGARKVSAALGKAYQGLRLGERVAAADFLYSFSGGVERGATLTDLKRNAAGLETPSAVIADALEEAKNRFFYLQYQNSKYFFANQPNLNRMVLVRSENVSDREIEEMEESLLRARVRSQRLKVFVWVERSADIPDTPDLKLVILREPNDVLMRTLLTEKGESPRVHRNTLIFLTPLPNERTAFGNLVRKKLAYQSLAADSTLHLTPEQQKEIKEQLKRVENDLNEAVRRVYRQLSLPSNNNTWKTFDLGLPTVGDTRPLDQEVYERLRMEGEILEKVAPLVIKEKYLQSPEWVSTAQIVQASLTTPGELRVASRSAWESGIAEGVRQGLFSLGEVQNDQPVCRYFKEECTPSFASMEALIRAEVCDAQRRAEEGRVAFPSGPTVAGQPLSDAPVSAPTGQPPLSPGVSAGGKYQQLHLNFVVPKGKVSSLMGVLNFLQSRYNRLEISLNLADGQLGEQEFEDKVKEAFRQMGIEIALTKK